ncbi:hypothetical protein ACQPZA_13305 [Pseudonocardia xinjiangensis]|uniref:tetratricopeptide repeat protein n=1 Tax=Pseudonocardia xinjiangensis TaxID=75289 RepID=UPI003D8EFC41
MSAAPTERQDAERPAARSAAAEDGDDRSGDRPAGAGSDGGTDHRSSVGDEQQSGSEDQGAERRSSVGNERPSGSQDRSSERRPSARSDRPSGDARGRGDRSGDRGPARDRGASSYGRGAGARSGGPRAGAAGGGRSSERSGRSRPTEGVPVARVAEPPLSDDITTAGLDPEVRRDLRGLQKDTADSVARHLVAAGMLVDDDPELALEHARFARTRASRIAVVREAAGIAAYHAGEWAEALSELRAARRMGGGPGHLAVMADIERALGRPERALDLSRGPEVRELGRAEAIELLIVAAGARRDLGEFDAAVIGLQVPELDPARREPWSSRLFYAHADNLLAAGRESDALEWFVHAANADADGETDAEIRIAELTGEPLLPEDDVEFGPEDLTDLPAGGDVADESGEPASDRPGADADVPDGPTDAVDDTADAPVSDAAVEATHPEVVGHDAPTEKVGDDDGAETGAATPTAGNDAPDGDAVAGDAEAAGTEVVTDDTAADGSGDATIGEAAGTPAAGADAEVRGDPTAPRGDARS